MDGPAITKFSNPLEDARPHKRTGEREVSGCVSDSATISRSPADTADGSLGCTEQDPTCAADVGYNYRSVSAEKAACGAAHEVLRAAASGLWDCG